MKLILLLIVFIFSILLGLNLSIIALNSNETKQNEAYCKNFRSGVFINECSTGHSSKFKRFNGIQVQEYGSYFLKEKNVWTADCAYRNTLLETNDPEITLYIGNSIHIRMINVTKNSYRTIEADSKDSSSSCEVKKIDEIDPSTTL
ncbi:hypothetical protein [Leptospira perdikensis]|uniref:Uncharacterized protein n=1 Tax=Leptospira perdikensis TaxID=2484948 RepID=A0A4V3JPL3_9LEPT|nr:hypothetical protein [Leptospira perdikensis]TGL45039.1 hypothetical protein EHQ49_06150 [Leptospira perdikensis]